MKLGQGFEHLYYLLEAAVAGLGVARGPVGLKEQPEPPVMEAEEAVEVAGSAGDAGVHRVERRERDPNALERRGRVVLERLAHTSVDEIVVVEGAYALDELNLDARVVRGRLPHRGTPGDDPRAIPRSQRRAS